MKDELDQRLDAIEQLPAAPVVMVKLIALFRQPDRDVDEVVNLLNHDPSLTAEVLRRCNGAMYGGVEPVVDIFDAIMRLGFYEVYRMAVTMFGVRTMESAKATGFSQAGDLWRHSAMAAVVSGIVAPQVGESEGLAYTAGLLHDIGKLALASADAPRYAALMAQAGGFGRMLENAERVSFGFGHAAVGARLLTRWGVPADVAAPVLYHHDTNWKPPFDRMSAIISLSDLAAHALEAEGEAAWDLPEMAPAMDLLHLDTAQLEALEQEARKQMIVLDGLFATAGAK